MYSSTIALAIAPLLFLANADVSFDRDDVPRECDAICDPIVQLTRTCDVDLRSDNDRDEDRLEVQCVCTNDSFDVGRVAALCADCMRQNINSGRDNDDDDDDRRDDMEDIEDILYTCGFSSVSYNAASATSYAQSISVEATRPTDVSQLTTTIVGGAAGGSGSGSNTRAGTTLTDSSGQPTATQDRSDDDATATGTGAAADATETNAAVGVKPFGVAAVVGVAMMMV